MRDWDRDVMQAMRMAAMLALFWYTEDADAKPQSVTGSMDLESGTMATAPPGYKPQQLNPAQPGQQYNVFRDAKLAEIGRPAGMPLMLVNLDSSKHSYASARFDDQTYRKTIESRQNRQEKRIVRPCLYAVMRESELLGLIPRRPAKVQYRFVWAKRPHVDPGKESSAIHQRMEDGTIDQGLACAEYSLDVDTVRAARERFGLPAGPTWMVDPAAPNTAKTEAQDE